jgi:hypothetical protein
MKRTLLLSFLMIIMTALSGGLYAQCTPDPSVTDPEGDGQMVPDTLEAWETTPMNDTLTIFCPDTANVGAGTIDIHHITIKSISNKPVWLSYACNPSNCQFAAGVAACVLVTGTPPVGSAGIVLMDVLVDVFMDYSGIPVQVAWDYNSGDKLVLVIHPPQGIEETNAAGFGIIQSQPNPFSGATKIGCYTRTPEQVTLQICDMLGNSVYQEKVSTQAGENYFRFNGSGLSGGVYFYTVTSGQNQKITKKMVKVD